MKLYLEPRSCEWREVSDHNCKKICSIKHTKSTANSARARTTINIDLSAVANHLPRTTFKTALQLRQSRPEYLGLIHHTLFSTSLPHPPLSSELEDKLLHLSPPPIPPQEQSNSQLPHRTLFGLLLLSGEESRRPRPPLSHAYEPFRPP
jgi:hypothetical protein